MAGVRAELMFKKDGASRGWYVRYMEAVELYSSVRGPWRHEKLPVPPDAGYRRARAALDQWKKDHGI